MKHHNPIQVDFSLDSGLQARLHEKLLSELNLHDNAEREVIPMKKTLKHSTRVALVALVSILILSGAALASLKAFSLGPFAAYTQYDGSDIAAMNEQPSGEVVSIPSDTGTAHVFDITRFTGLDDVKPLLAFDPALPKALPEGCTLDHFELFNEQGKPAPGSKYLTAVYATAAGELNLMIQLMDEETAYEVTASGVQFRSFKGKGHDAVTDGKNLDVLVGDVMYAFSPCWSGVTLDELVKMAESI